MKKTLWIITELFPPEETSTGYIMGEIANAMTQKYDVKVICGPAVYDSAKKQDEKHNTAIDNFIDVIRVNPIIENKSSKLSRMKKFLLMSWNLYSVAKVKIKKDDHVLMVTNPFPLIVLMGHLRRHRSFTMNLLVHDVMPESLYTELNVPLCIYKVVLKVFNKAYASADQLIAIGRDMKEILEGKCSSYSHKPRISIIENWSDVKSINPTGILKSDKVVIQYAGNIGKSQGVGDFVELIHEADCKNVSFGIWGTGTTENAIKDKVKEYGMTDRITFHGSYLRSQQQEVLNSCDIALVRLVDGMYGLGVPSKTYNILAAGKPILYIGERNTEVWRLIEEYGNGVCFEPHDKKGLIKYLQHLSVEDKPLLADMGKVSRKLAEEKFSKATILDKFIELI